MTHTIDHDCPAQSQHFNGHDVQYKESDDPAEQSSSEVDLLTFVTALLLAKRSFENRVVPVLEKLAENTTLQQIARTTYHITQHIDNSAGLKRVQYLHQHLTQSVADQLRATVNDYRH